MARGLQVPKKGDWVDDDTEAGKGVKKWGGFLI